MKKKNRHSFVCYCHAKKAKNIIVEHKYYTDIFEFAWTLYGTPSDKNDGIKKYRITVEEMK